MEDLPIPEERAMDTCDEVNNMVRTNLLGEDRAKYRCVFVFYQAIEEGLGRLMGRGLEKRVRLRLDRV